MKGPWRHFKSGSETRDFVLLSDLRRPIFIAYNPDLNLRSRFQDYFGALASLELNRFSNLNELCILSLTEPTAAAHAAAPEHALFQRA